MPFPITIDGLAMTPELPHVYGPFGVQAALYTVNSVQFDGITALLTMFKSLDEGVTWQAVDAANGPPVNFGGLAHLSFSAAEVGDLIWVFYQDSNLGVGLRKFDKNTDTWGDFFSTNFSITTVGPVCYRASDNAIVGVSTRNVTIDTIQHVIPLFWVFDIAGESFSVVQDLDYLDYDTPLFWAQAPVGLCIDSDGVLHVFTAQATSVGSPGLQSLTFGFPNTNIPVGCFEILNLSLLGGGGGGAGENGTGNGGGGGGGGGYTFVASGIMVTPFSAEPTVFGFGGQGGIAGGAAAEPGGDTEFVGHVAGGGGAGIVAAGGGGGLGETFNGGNGGAGGAGEGGGGGGGAAGASGAGFDGDDQSGNIGGFGGAGNGTGSPFSSGAGGSGGDGSDANANGFPGDPRGGGGGGSSGLTGLPDPPGGSPGNNGALFAQYVQTFDVRPGRLWHQAVNPDNSYGTLQEIIEGQFACQTGNSVPRPVINFACVAGTGFLAIAFSGQDDGLNTIVKVGKATNGVDLMFTFQDVATGTTESAVSPGAAVAINPMGELYLAYVRGLEDEDTDFFFRIDTGSGFGAASLLGVFNNPGCRIVMAFLQTFLGGIFGTPTISGPSGFSGGEGSPDFLGFQSIIPGVSGNFIYVFLELEESALDVDVQIVSNGLVQQINVTCGYTVEMAGNILNAGSWENVANAINADAGHLVLSTGSATDVASLSGFFALSGGTSGGGTV